MQLEVAERLIAKPSSKQYGIPSVVFQLYSSPKMQFKIPPTVFYPPPKVDSALVTLDFTNPNPQLKRVNIRHFRRSADSYYCFIKLDYFVSFRVVTAAFNQRRKMLRQSLKGLK